MEKNRIFSFKQWKFEPNYEILQFLSKKEGFLLLFQQLEDEDQFLCGESQCWSWSRKNPSSPAPAGSLQLRAPLLRSQKLGALNHTLLTPGLVIDTNCECFNPRMWNQKLLFCVNTLNAYDSSKKWTFVTIVPFTKPWKCTCHKKRIQVNWTSGVKVMVVQDLSDLSQNWGFTFCECIFKQP